MPVVGKFENTTKILIGFFVKCLLQFNFCLFKSDIFIIMKILTILLGVLIILTILLIIGLKSVSKEVRNIEEGPIIFSMTRKGSWIIKDPQPTLELVKEAKLYMDMRRRKLFNSRIELLIKVLEDLQKE